MGIVTICDSSLNPFEVGAVDSSSMKNQGIHNLEYIVA